jgi:nucleotide-binding universal stress UspA family protein
MPQPARTLNRVLCATDLSEFGNRAVDMAFAAAEPGGSVTLVHVVREPPVPSPLVSHYGERRPSADELAKQQRKAADRLTALAESAAQGRKVRFEVRTPRAPKVAEALLAEAENLDADLIVVVTRSRSGLAKFVLGSAAHDVLYEAGRPVLLVPPEGD